MPKEILIGEPRYKKLERIEERYELLMSTWEKYMNANGRRRELPDHMTKQRFPKLTGTELTEYMKSGYCKGMFPDEILVELERAGK